MSSSPKRASGDGQLPPKRATDEQSPLVCRRARDPDGETEWTFFEADREPERRTTRWLTADESDVVPESEWA